MQGVVARRNNFTEPILEFFEDGVRGVRRADRPLLRPGQPVQDRRRRHGVRVARIGRGEHRSGGRLPARARAARRSDRFTSTSSVPSPKRPSSRRWPARRTSSSSSAPTSRWRATTRWGATSARRCNKALQGEAGLPAHHGRPDAAAVRRASTASARAISGPSTRSARTSSRRAARARKDGKRASDGASFMVLGVDHPYEVKSDETPSLLPEGAIAVRFHSVGGWGAITTGKNLGAIIGDLNDLLYERDKVVDEFGNPKEIIHVSANPKYGSEKKGAPTSYFMVAAPERIRVNCDLRHVNVVLCCDPEGVHAHQPARRHVRGRLPRLGIRGRRRAGVGAAAALGAQADHRQEDPRVHAARLRDRAQGDRPRRPAAAHAGQRVPRRVLRRVAAARRSSASRQEQFREVVHKQYVKKFGRLGDAVVNSNMEVMTQGFERVREIQVGELDGARSLDAARQGAAAGGSATNGHGDGVRLRLPLASRCRRARRSGRRSRGSRRSTRCSGRGSATTSRRRRWRRSASWRRAAATRRRSTSRAAKRRSTFPRTARSAWSASRSVRTRRCPTARRISRRCSGRRSRNYVTDAGERQKMLQLAAGDREADARADARRGRQERQDAAAADSSARSPTRSTASRRRPSSQFFDVIDKVPMAYQKTNAIFATPEKKTPGGGRRLLDLRVGPLQGLRGLRHGVRRAPGAADGAGDRGGQRRARDAAPPSSICCPTRRRSTSASTTTRARRTRRRPRCATC